MITDLCGLFLAYSTLVSEMYFLIFNKTQAALVLLVKPIFSYNLIKLTMENKLLQE